jgi:hypothetical protein
MLGTYTQLIRMGKYAKDKHVELQALGFMYENQRAKYGFEFVKAALIRYKVEYTRKLICIIILIYVR